MPRTFVPFTVTVCGIDELDSFGAAGVTHVLSILDPDHPEPTAFGSYGEHQRLELRFHDVIEELPGQVAPTLEDVARILAFGRDVLAEPAGCGHLIVHCHAGISRSTASLTMMLAQAKPELPAADAMAAVVSIRHKAWPNLRMIEFADEILERGGDLVRAVRARHRAYALAHPEMADYMRANGRTREVEGL